MIVVTKSIIQRRAEAEETPHMVIWDTGTSVYIVTLGNEAGDVSPE